MIWSHEDTNTKDQSLLAGVSARQRPRNGLGTFFSINHLEYPTSCVPSISRPRLQVFIPEFPDNSPQLRALYLTSSRSARLRAERPCRRRYTLLQPPRRERTRLPRCRYVDGVKKYEQANVTSIDTSLTMTTGTHRLTVQALDSSGTFKATEYVTVH